MTYQNAGVDINKGSQLIEAIKPLASATKIAGVMAGLGGFGAMFEVGQLNYKNPVLVSATDGVGTKLMLAKILNKHDTIGIDLVAMCVNDLIVQGAKPLFFLDYFATSKLDISLATAVIKGIADGCQQSKCALVGGETAEMPGMYQNDEYDLAGFCVGIVEKDDIIDGSKVCEGDEIIALASSGPHSNGFSLIRKVLAEANPSAAEMSQLIEPTKIYVQSILSLIENFTVHSIAHITGGGLLENIPRVLPQGLAAKLDTKSWQLPSIFTWLKKHGNISTFEMRKVFNCGVGMVIVVPFGSSAAAISQLKKSGENAWLIGEVVKNPDEQVIFE